MFWWLGVASLVMFVGSLMLVPWLLVRIPADYFARDRSRRGRRGSRHPAIRIAGLVLKNILGIFLLLAGVTMLALPGQGLVTVFLGLLLINFPGKNALVRRILRQPKVLHTINVMREKAHRPPLQVDEDVG